MKVICLVASLFIVLSISQLRAQSANSFYDFNYSTLGYYPTFYLSRPSDSYQSIRIRSLSNAFTSLIEDNYTDYFLNPASCVNSSSSELISDFTPSTGGGKYFIGSSINVKKNNFFNIFLNLDKINSSSSSNGGYSFSPSPLTSRDYSRESFQRKYGGTLSYGFQLSPATTLGIGYQINTTHYDEKYISSAIEPNSSTQSSSTSYDDSRTKGSYHRVKIGWKRNTDESMVSAVLTGLFSTFTVGYESYRYHRNPPNLTITNSISPYDISSSGFMFSLVLNNKLSENLKRMFLLEVGYTSYDVTGNLISHDSSSNYYSEMIQKRLSESDGAIFDIKAGCAFEKNISDKAKAYVGVTMNYIRNSLDNELFSTTKNITSSSNSTSYFQTTGSNLKQGFELLLPIGTEIFIGDIVTLRGGLEPRFKIIGSDSTGTIFSQYTTSYYQFDYQTLSLTSNLGLGVHYEEFGDINILFSNTLTDMSTWSFSYRYFL